MHFHFRLRNRLIKPFRQPYLSTWFFSTVSLKNPFLPFLFAQVNEFYNCAQIKTTDIQILKSLSCCIAQIEGLSVVYQRTQISSNLNCGLKM